MDDTARLGPWVRRFLLEHLIGERNLSVNTQRSYRDTLALLIPFVARQIHKKVDELTVLDVSEKCVAGFLVDLEEARGCSTSTRNQRLAAIHALSHFVAVHSPGVRRTEPGTTLIIGFRQHHCSIGLLPYLCCHQCATETAARA